MTFLFDLENGKYAEITISEDGTLIGARFTDGTPMRVDLPQIKRIPDLDTTKLAHGLVSAASLNVTIPDSAQTTLHKPTSNPTSRTPKRASNLLKLADLDTLITQFIKRALEITDLFPQGLVELTMPIEGSRNLHMQLQRQTDGINSTLSRNALSSSKVSESGHEFSDSSHSLLEADDVDFSLEPLHLQITHSLFNASISLTRHDSSFPVGSSSDSQPTGKDPDTDPNNDRFKVGETISSVEELDTLPEGTILRDEDENGAWEKDGSYFFYAGNEAGFTSSDLDDGNVFTILWLPETGERA